jgi:hypothetical protein
MHLLAFLLTFCIFLYESENWLQIILNADILFGPGRWVGIATGYGLDGPVIEFQWEARFSATVQNGPEAYPASCTSTGSFPRVESGRGVTLTPHPLLVPKSKNRVQLYLTLPKGLRGL